MENLAALAILEGVRVQIDPEYDRRCEDSRHAACVSIRTFDMKLLKREVLERPERPGNPMLTEAFAEKFEALAGYISRRERLRTLFCSIEMRICLH